MVLNIGQKKKKHVDKVIAKRWECLGKWIAQITIIKNEDIIDNLRTIPVGDKIRENFLRWLLTNIGK